MRSNKTSWLSSADTFFFFIPLFRLTIQTDENDALKEALNSTLRAKEEDLKFYQEMMDQTKKVFLQGLRQFRQNSAPT